MSLECGETTVQAFGLKVALCDPLAPRMRRDASAAPEADVVARPGRVEPLPAALRDGRQVVPDREGVLCFWNEVGAFLVREEREIVVEAAPGAEEAILRHYLLGPVLAVALHQRGLLVLHASAVRIGQGAVVFMGDSGWGKSTLAAVFYQQGHALVTDEVCALRFDGAAAWVLPALPQLRLWPDAARALGIDPETLPRVHGRAQKRTLPASRGFPSQPLPLRRVYLLAEGEGAISALEPSQAFVELLCHSYCRGLLRFSGARSHFLHCGQLVKGLGVRRLRIPHSFDRLGETVDRVMGNVLDHAEPCNTAKQKGGYAAR